MLLLRMCSLCAVENAEHFLNLNKRHVLQRFRGRARRINLLFIIFEKICWHRSRNKPGLETSASFVSKFKEYDLNLIFSGRFCCLSSLYQCAGRRYNINLICYGSTAFVCADVFRILMVRSMSRSRLSTGFDFDEIG